MKKLQKLIAMIALVAAVLALFTGCVEEATQKLKDEITGNQTQEGEKTITVAVTYADGKTKFFTYTTSEMYLGPVLRAEGLVTGHYDGDSFFVDAVDGLTADYSENESWWKLLDNGEQTMVGIDEIALKDGGKYQLQYTIGF